MSNTTKWREEGKGEGRREETNRRGLNEEEKRGAESEVSKKAHLLSCLAYPSWKTQACEPYHYTISTSSLAAVTYHLVCEYALKEPSSVTQQKKHEHFPLLP